MPSVDIDPQVRPPQVWTFQVAHLRKLEADSWPGYVDDVRRCAIAQDETTITIDATSDCFQSLKAKRGEHDLSKANEVVQQQHRVDPVQPVPRSEWPWPVRVVAKFASTGDAGVGDTIRRLLGKGGDAFKALAEALGTSCGCGERQIQLNAKYPYA